MDERDCSEENRVFINIFHHYYCILWSKRKKLQIEGFTVAKLA